MINDNIKNMLNELQRHITHDTDKILLIFNDMQQLNKWKRKHQNDSKYLNDFILLTLGELIYEHKLIGIRFKSYNFMLWEEEQC